MGWYFISPFVSDVPLKENLQLVISAPECCTDEHERSCAVKGEHMLGMQLIEPYMSTSR